MSINWPGQLWNLTAENVEFINAAYNVLVQEYQ